MLHIAALDVTATAKITPVLTQLSRAEITSCPSYGARIVSQILGDLKLYDQWLKDLATMNNRMKTMREGLYHGLLVRKVQGSWKHILTDVRKPSICGRQRRHGGLLADRVIDWYVFHDRTLHYASHGDERETPHLSTSFRKNLCHWM
jgi:aspartate aminotransferase